LRHISRTCATEAGQVHQVHQVPILHKRSGPTTQARWTITGLLDVHLQPVSRPVNNAEHDHLP
jgi:hypothetical protein